MSIFARLFGKTDKASSLEGQNLSPSTVTVASDGGLRSVDLRGVRALDEALEGATSGDILHAVDPRRSLRFEAGGPSVWSIAHGARRDTTLYLTYGLSGRIDEDPARSHLGYELSLQASGPGQWWQYALLRQLAKYVVTSGRELAVGDWFSFRGPLPAATLGPGAPPSEPHTHLTAVAIAADPVLPRIETPRGQLEVRRVYGLSDMDIRLIETWSCSGFMELVAQRDAELLTDLRRPEWKAEPSFIAARAERAPREGAARGFLDVPGLRWMSDADDDERYRVLVPAPRDGQRIAKFMHARLSFDRDVLLHCMDGGPGTEVSVTRGPSLEASSHGNRLSIVLPADTLLPNALSAGQPLVLSRPDGLKVHWEFA